MTAPAQERSISLPKRLWIYQAERFPLAMTGLLVAVFVLSGISVSAALGGRSLPPVVEIVAVWFATLTMFFQMRAADEHKDLPDDRRYRPERPIPSGLVSLRLILLLAGALSIVALTAVAMVDPHLIWLIVAAWVWIGLMTVEFFAPRWLKARPLLYGVSHMAIMPVIAIFATGADWLTADAAPSPALGWFCALSFALGAVVEIGRKVRAPNDERRGVDTYSALYGPTRAALAWACSALLAAACLVGLANALGAAVAIELVAALIVIASATLAAMFALIPSPATARWIDRSSGLLVLVGYSVLAVVAISIGGAT